MSHGISEETFERQNKKSWVCLANKVSSMGMFDILVAYKKCKYCGLIHKHEIQFNIKNSFMHNYYIGDKTKFKKGVYDGLYLDYHSPKIKNTKIIVHDSGILSIQDPFYTHEKFEKENKNGD